MIRKKIYVGVKSDGTNTIPNRRVLFRTIYDPPSRITNPEFVYVIGPFKTVRAAQYCVDFPHAQCNSVKEFEIAACVRANQSELIADRAKYLTNSSRNK